MRILGVDPGLRRTGFGVIDLNGARLTYVASGTIVVPSDITLPLRLKMILDSLRQVVEETKPDIAALEIVFMNTNPATTLLLGARSPIAVWPCMNTARCKLKNLLSVQGVPLKNKCS